MIDPTKEPLISLAEGSGMLPGRRVGKRVSSRTMARYIQTGVRGIVLESVLAGGTRCTSREAIVRFIERLSSQAKAGRGKLTALPPQERAERAGEKLDSMGI